MTRSDPGSDAGSGHDATPGAGAGPAPIVVSTGTADGTRRAARIIAAHLRAGDLLVLDGPLGTGKTTFTQGIGEELEVRGPVASPTFVISRVHPSLRGGPQLAHVDAYRLAGGFDIDDLDLEAELDSAVTVVEWGRDSVEHLVDDYLLIELQRPEQGEDDADEEPRTILVTAVGRRWDAAAIDALRTDLTRAERGARKKGAGLRHSDG